MSQVWISAASTIGLITPHLHKITGFDSEEHRNNASLNNALILGFVTLVFLAMAF